MTNENWIQPVSGFCSAIARYLVYFPGQVIKIRMQQNPYKYKSVIYTIKHILLYQRVSTFYRGCGFPLIIVGAITSIQFTLIDKIFSQFNQFKISNFLLTGSFVGFLSSFLICPLQQAICCRQMIPSYKQIPTRQTILILYRNQGIKRIYKGMQFLLVRQTIGQAFYYGGYFYLKSIIGNVASGFLAGFLYWMFVYPIDTMKTRIMLDQHNKYKNSMAVLKQVLKQPILVMHKGFSLVLIRSMSVSGIGFLGYQKSKTMFKNDY